MDKNICVKPQVSRSFKDAAGNKHSVAHYCKYCDNSETCENCDNSGTSKLKDTSVLLHRHCQQLRTHSDKKKTQN